MECMYKGRTANLRFSLALTVCPEPIQHSEVKIFKFADPSFFFFHPTNCCLQFTLCGRVRITCLLMQYFLKLYLVLNLFLKTMVKTNGAFQNLTYQ